MAFTPPPLPPPLLPFDPEIIALPWPLDLVRSSQSPRFPLTLAQIIYSLDMFYRKFGPASPLNHRCELGCHRRATPPALRKPTVCQGGPLGLCSPCLVFGLPWLPVRRHVLVQNMADAFFSASLRSNACGATHQARNGHHGTGGKKKKNCGRGLWGTGKNIHLAFPAPRLIVHVTYPLPPCRLGNNSCI